MSHLKVESAFCSSYPF